MNDVKDDVIELLATIDRATVQANRRNGERIARCPNQSASAEAKREWQRDYPYVDTEAARRTAAQKWLVDYREQILTEASAGATS